MPSPRARTPWCSSSTTSTKWPTSCGATWNGSCAIRPPGLRVVLATRSDPPIGLGRLRLEGWLTEVRARDLAFTLDEATELLHALGVTVPAAALATLWERTEGWAAALCLAALSVRAHPEPECFIERFAGTDATVSDYLVSEVLAQQPPDLRAFLLRTSIVDRLCGELADALTGGSDGQQLLRRLEQGGALLASLDDHGVWYRYHPLFAELLRAELRAQLGTELDGLQRRAATWLAAHGHHAAALRHVALGGAWDLGTELIVDSWIDLLVNDETATLRAALEAVPRERVDACPELALAFGAALLAVGKPQLAEAYLQAAAEAESSLAPERRSRFAAASVAVRLYGGRIGADPATALDAARARLERDAVLDGDDVTPDVRGLLLTQLGIVELWTGELGAAVEHLEHACAVADEARSGWTSFASIAHLALANVLRGEFMRAVRRADESLVIAERHGWTRSEPAAAAYSALAAIGIQRGRLDQAERLVEQASAALRDTRDRPLRAMHALNRVQLLSDRGEHAVALDLVRRTREQFEGVCLPAAIGASLAAEEGLLHATAWAPEAGRALLQRAVDDGASSLAVANALARVDLLEGEAQPAHVRLAPYLEGVRSGVAVPLQACAEAWLLDALALDLLAEHDAAAGSLERALDLAEPAGLRRAIVSHGSAIGPLLRRHVRYGTAHPAMVSDALQTIEHRVRADRHPTPAALADPLSKREQAILGYLPTMMSNQQVAGEMLISVNTVKTHLKAIYRKLDATGRREAVQRARELALLP
jgi:LuxR family maltose regulon positive regulatory protein